MSKRSFDDAFMEYGNLETMPLSLFADVVKNLEPEDFLRLASVSRKLSEMCKRVEDSVFRSYYYKSFEQNLPVTINAKTVYQATRTSWLVQVPNYHAFLLRSDLSIKDLLISFLKGEYRKYSWDSLRYFASHYSGIHFERQISKETRLREPHIDYNRYVYSHKGKLSRPAWFAEQQNIYDNSFRFQFDVRNETLMTYMETLIFDHKRLEIQYSEQPFEDIALFSV